jgi:uncharacterized protein (DUF1501 family)
LAPISDTFSLQVFSLPQAVCRACCRQEGWRHQACALQENDMRTFTRRDFLKTSAVAAAAITPAFGSGIDPNEDYKALVCVLLEGGADTLDMVIPKFDVHAHRSYTQVRTGLAHPRRKIRPLVGSRYGLHPAMPNLQKRYHLKDLAIVANVGTLEEPVTKSAILRGAATLPPQLFQRVAQRDWAMDAGGTNGWGTILGVR